MATAPPPTKVWNKDDLIALVVWLEVCRQCEEDMNFVQTITDHLFNTRRKLFTYGQVRSKLHTLARSNQPPWETKTSKSMTLHHILCGGSSLLFPRLEKSGLSPKELQQRVDNCLIENQLHKSTNRTEVLTINNQSQDVRLPTTRHKTLAERKSDNAPSEPLETQEHTVSQRPDYASAQCSSGPEVPARIEEQLPRNEPLGADLSKTSTLQVRWGKEVEALLAKNIELQEKNRKLGDLLQLAENAQLLRGQASKDPQEGLIHIHIAMIYEQQQKIKSLQDQVPRLAHVPTQALDLPPGKLDGTIRILGSEIESILHGTNCFHLQAPVIPEESDLGLLLQSCQVDSNPDCPLESYLESCVSEYGLPATVRTLVLAALRDWVFASDFPNYGGNGTSSALLKSYRDIVYNLGDWKTLRNYDIAACSQMFNSEQFSLMILPFRAGQLADRFMKAIDGILSSRSVEQYLQPQSPKGFEDLHFRLVEIFKTSLDLKAHTIVTENDYLFMVHPMGTPFTQIADESRTSATTWLHASFRVYPAGPPNIHDRQADAIVQTTNFISKEDAAQMGSCLLEKHVAVRKSERSPFGSGQLPPRKRPLPSEFQDPRQHKRISTPPQDLIDQPEGTQAGGHLNAPDVASRTCDCGKILANIHNYQRHVADKSCRRCKSCGKNFSSNRRSDFWDHLRTEHPESEQTKKLPVQESAQVTAVATGSNSQELPGEAKSTQFLCDNCPKSFSRGHSLAKHKTEQRCSWCYECSRDFRVGRLLREHQAEEHRPSNHNTELSRTAPTPNAKSTPKMKRVHQNNKGALPRESEKVGAPRSILTILPLRCSKCPEGQLEEFASPADLQRHQRRVHRRLTAKGRSLQESNITLGAPTSPNFQDTVSPSPERQLTTAQTLEAGIDDTGLGFTRLASRERATYRQRKGPDRHSSQASSKEQKGGLEITKGNLFRSSLGLGQPAACNTASSSCTIEDLEQEAPSQDREELVDKFENSHEDNAHSQVPKQRGSDRPKPSSSSSISIQIPYNSLLREGVE
ncbi:hypothetical protein DL98DRAFT_594842 [Cadophora sp. DSE1049]|nr:hypothetical protein DL98DRAFT_594842 [Cadophora sp. DSE1049]